MKTQILNKPLYSVSEAAQLIGIGKTRFYQELAEGKIAAKKLGRRTLVPAEAIQNYIASLPAL